MTRRLIVACGCLLGLVVADARADCPELVGRWPYGPAYAVAVSGDYAYFTSGAALMVADVSEPSAPRVVGDVALPGPAQDIAVSGGYAYVFWGVLFKQGGLCVIDVSTPSGPVVVSCFASPPTSSGVAVSGSYAYVAGGSQGSTGLRVIDVSTPSALVEVGFLETQGMIYGLAVSGGYAYLATGSDGLRVIDVGNPAAPVEVGFLETQGWYGVVVSGGYAYVTESLDDQQGIRVIDVRTPSVPVEVGFVDVPYASDVAVAEGYAYVLAAAGLSVIDVSTPSAPVEVGLVDTQGGSAIAVAVLDGYAYTTAYSGGLRVIDVRTPSAPVEIGFLDTPGEAYAVAVSGSYAYLGDENGLRVIDVSTPSIPVEVGFVGTQASLHGVATLGSYAYIADDGGLRVIDIRTPSEPVEVGFVATTGLASDIALSRGHAYVTAGDQTLRVIDVRTPTTPQEVGFVSMAGYGEGVAVSGGYAYVAVVWPGLRVIDVNIPSAPVEVGFVYTPGAVGVAVSGGYAYVAAQSAGLRVIDISTPSAPVEVGFVDDQGWPGDDCRAVAVSGGYAYVADGSAGLRVIDIRTPSAPVELGSIGVAGRASDVAVSGGYVFLASGAAGLSVFTACGEAFTDVYESFIPAAAVAAGAEGAFFQTDVEINNTGPEAAEVSLQWLPRGEDNSEPVSSDLFTLAAGASLRFDNVLTEVFGLEPDSVGALKMVASTESVIGMSRTYNSPGGKAAGTFGQGLPAVSATEMITGTEARRIIFLSEDADSRANVGCVNGGSDPLSINIGIFDDEGSLLETRTMNLGPWSNNQLNRVFEEYAPVNGYVDVWGDNEDAIFTCYGSMLDNETSDPTTILPQVPSSDTIFIPAAALAAGLEGSFFTTDLDLNNVGSDDITYELLWLPRGADNTDAVRSDTFSLAAGSGVRYANVLGEVFGLEPDQVGALEIEASGAGLLAMSRTYNTPSGDAAGTFGQAIPGVPTDRMIPTGVTKRIIFLSENEDFRANLGCVNGADAEVVVRIDLFDSDGFGLATRSMVLPPFSNKQLNGIFADQAPINGYVDVRTNTPDAAFTCYGSVLDDLTSDPTTVLPQ